MRVALVALTLIYIISVKAQLVDPDPDPAIVPPNNPGGGGSRNNWNQDASEFSLINGNKFLTAVRSSIFQFLNEVFITDLFNCVNAALYLFE